MWNMLEWPHGTHRRICIQDSDPDLALLEELLTAPRESFSPERILVETFEFVEVFCGVNSPFTTAALAVGLRQTKGSYPFGALEISPQG